MFACVFKILGSLTPAPLLSSQYDIQAKVRSFSALNRMGAIKAVGPAIGLGHIVDLKTPEVTVIIEVAMVRHCTCLCTFQC